MNTTFALSGIGLAILAISLPMAKRRLELSQAKHPSLTGHARMARRVAALVPGYAYDNLRFFQSDDAPPEVVAARRAGFARLSALFRARYVQTVKLTQRTQAGLSDLQSLTELALELTGLLLWREVREMASR